MSSSWRPLLDGGLAARAREAVDAIARDLPSAAAWAPAALSTAGASAWRASLASGSAGQALLYAYLAFDAAPGSDEEPSGGADPADPAHPADTALELLDQAAEAVAAIPMSDGFYTGFPGIAWVENHLRGRLFEGDEESSREIDEALLPALEASPWRGEYDLINGLVGLGIYALEGLPRPTAAACLERVIERLAERAEDSAEGTAWFSPAAAIPAWQRERFPQGLYNLGTSHGMAGVAGLLGAAVGAGIATATARPLLAGVLAWLMAHRQGPESPFCFPHFYFPGVESTPSRLAWCYGDLGMAATLLVAARGAGEPAWERMALEIARAAAERTFESSRVSDAGLCHGAGGVAHLFNRIYQTTGEARLGEAARFWYERTLGFRQPGLGVGGFRAWSADVTGVQDWRNDPGFLEGAAGVALALLAAVSGIEPEWDRALLVSSRG